MNKIYSFLLILTVIGFTFTSCDDEDYTGYSELTPTSPTISVDLAGAGVAGGVTTSEMETTYEIPVTMSEAQIVDVAVYIFQTDGDATEGDDYTIDNNNGRVLISAGNTTGMVSITILEDDLMEATETFTIQIGDHRVSNAQMEPVTVSFTINNTTADDLVIGMEWSGVAFDAEDGSEISPTALADLRLLVTDGSNPYTAILGGADGGSFEEYTMVGADFADGTYYVVADFYSALDLGFGVDLGITVTFDQSGVINGQTYSFDAALNTAVTCPASHFYLASIVKSGSTYTITPVGAGPAVDLEGLAGVFDVVSNGSSTDAAPVNNPIVDFMSTVTITHDGDGLYSMSDATAGVYIDWYCAPYGACDPVAGTFQRDACNDITGTWVGPFGSTFNMTGSIDTSDGSIEMTWVNGFDDTATSVYTPQ